MCREHTFNHILKSVLVLGHDRSSHVWVNSMRGVLPLVFAKILQFQVVHLIGKRDRPCARLVGHAIHDRVFRPRAHAFARDRASTPPRDDRRARRRAIVRARAIAIAERRKGDRRRRRCRRGAGRRRARRMAWLANTQRAEDRAGRGRRRSVECSGRSRGRSWRRWR